jgi:hypothetical protein
MVPLIHINAPVGGFSDPAFEQVQWFELNQEFDNQLAVDALPHRDDEPEPV